MTIGEFKLKTFPATPARWKDVEQLFGDRGACGGCWCMFWRIPRKQYEASKGGENKRAFKSIIDSGCKPGVIAYTGKDPIGWCAVAPRSSYVGLERSRILRPIDDEPVWSISCLFVAKGFRRQGVSTKLVVAAAELAKRQGARILEGYPVQPTNNNMSDAFLWHGVPATFSAAGFKEVLRRSPSRPIMRLVLKNSDCCCSLLSC